MTQDSLVVRPVIFGGSGHPNPHQWTPQSHLEPCADHRFSRDLLGESVSAHLKPAHVSGCTPGPFFDRKDSKDERTQSSLVAAAKARV